jgi:hypothetical protein
MNKDTFQGQILIPFTHSYCVLPDDAAGRIAGEVWWMNQGFSVLIFLHYSVMVLQAHMSPGG